MQRCQQLAPLLPGCSQVMRWVPLGHSPTGDSQNSVRPHPVVVELIMAGGYGLAESRAAQADLMRLQAGGWLGC